jgi:hypothetical protein
VRGIALGAKKKLIGYANQVALIALVAAAFAVLAVTRFRIAGFVLAAIALVAIAWRARRSFSRVIGLTLLLAAGLLAAYYRGAPGNTTALVITGVLLVGMIASQPILADLTRETGMRAANLPGYRREAKTLVPVRVLNLKYLALVGLTGIFAAAKWTAWPLAAITAVATAITAVVALQALRARVRGGDVEKRIRAALEKYQPEFAVHFSAPDNTEYHVEMWRSYFERIDRPWMIITREPSPFTKMASASAPAKVPVLYCINQEQLDEAVVPSLKAVFYVNNGMKNCHLVRFTNLTHIFVGHGDSEKPAGYNPVAGMYTRIFVPGQASIDRYHTHGVAIPTEKFDIVGRPQAEGVQVATTHIRDLANHTVLYSTTWTSHFDDGNHCSLPIGTKIVQALLDRGATVIFRPHPYVFKSPVSRRQAAAVTELLAADQAKTGRAHKFGAAATTTMSLADCVNAADALITDVSGVVTEALYSLKPLALTNMLGESGAAYASSFPLSKAAYIIDADGGNMDLVLDDLLEKDSLEDARRALKSHYLGDFPPDRYADGFLDTARRYIG